MSADFVVGKDKVDLSSFGYQGFEEVSDKLGTSNEGFARFSDDGCSIIFYGVYVEQLTAIDFILV